ncbi:MAG: hypothetical protein KGZ79_11280 [Dethiobacter sp.]|jgi:hypothetical protein|nr:hypothetical protein [Dethiobacter sp.]
MGLLKGVKDKLSKGAKEAPIINGEAGYNIDYRNPGDESHFVRINQKQPAANVKRVVYDAFVSGISRNEGTVNSFIDGTYRKVSVERQPKGKKVLLVNGSWLDDKNNMQQGQLGIVEGFFAEEVFEKTQSNTPLYATIKVMFRARDGKHPGIRLDIWGTEVEYTPEELEAKYLKDVKKTEREAKKNDWGVAPAPYENLAKMYRKQKDYDKEVEILERFAKQKHAPGAMPPKLFERLEKAKKLSDRK